MIDDKGEYIQWYTGYEQNCRAYKDRVMGTIVTHGGGKIINNLRIRKLTPKECGRLMGLKDEDIDKILKNQNDNSAYHLFGDSIVVNVLMAIFGVMIDKK